MNQIAHLGMNELAGLWQAADRAGRAIAPAWPLAATVAVNPFLGQSSLTLAETAALLARLAGADLFPPRAHVKGKIDRGEVTREDLALALARYPVPGVEGPDALIVLAGQERVPAQPVPDIAALAAEATGTDWPRLVGERIGLFAAGYFDEGQALWTMAPGKGAYAAWRLFAMHDLTPEIAGLRGFAAGVADLPLTARELIGQAGEALGLGRDPGTYFHQLLLGLGGYAQYARHLQFVAERDGGEDQTTLDLLAIRLAFELALFRLHRQALERPWKEALAIHRMPPEPDPSMLADAVLQEACELAHARRLAALVEGGQVTARAGVRYGTSRPFAQAAFCIDVRSEVFRRVLETADPAIETIGFAGFFGMGVAHRAAASDLPEHRLPVLLPAGRFSCEAVPEASDSRRRYRDRASRAFGRFRQAAVSSFAFIEAKGLAYAGNLLRDTLRLSTRTPKAARPRFAEDMALDARAGMAETVLRAMSLTDNFARLVLLAGHGATSANNPFLSALQCGACGGHAGDVNARLLAALLNEDAVCAALRGRGIAIPADTLFVPALHDTTTDAVTLFLEDVDMSGHAADLGRLEQALAAAGRLARMERAKRLPRAAEASLAGRSRDWAETRPEWGLAGCAAFIAAPRFLTESACLGGRAFLHDYAWEKDQDFKVLELILTAPVVVANWINLQYYGSSVAPALFGAGNKLLHNVVGGIGVLEGNGGLMRAGLPWQSVHDGEALAHDPLRLSVFVAAPEQAINDVLQRHPGVRQLIEQGWLHLFRIGAAGQPTRRYAGALRWEPLPELFAAAAGSGIPEPVADVRSCPGGGFTPG